MVNWSVRYGSSLRKRYLEVAKQKKSRYTCDVCGKNSVKRISTGVWKCKSCGSTFAGGAYTFKTEPGRNVQRIIEQLYTGATHAQKKSEKSEAQ